MPPSPLASATVPRHLLRGLIGLFALVAALIGSSLAGPAALGLLGVVVIAWRGCPGCWLLGLAATREQAACRRCPGPAPAEPAGR